MKYKIGRAVNLKVNGFAVNKCYICNKAKSKVFLYANNKKELGYCLDCFAEIYKHADFRKLMKCSRRVRSTLKHKRLI